MVNHIKRKAKKRKAILVVAGVLLLVCVAVVTVFLLTGHNSIERKQYEAQIKEETENFTDELISELEQIDTSNEGSKEEAELSSTEASELAKLEDNRKQQVLQTLTATYNKILNEQKQEALRMVDNLVEQGKADWAALVDKGEATAVSKAKLASEYLAKSQIMEDQMDASFHSLTKKMEEQLQAEGINPTKIIEQYMAEYKRIKEDNRSTMMKKVLDSI